jgi:hypothetical protein
MPKLIHFLGPRLRALLFWLAAPWILRDLAERFPQPWVRREWDGKEMLWGLTENGLDVALRASGVLLSNSDLRRINGDGRVGLKVHSEIMRELIARIRYLPGQSVKDLAVLFVLAQATCDRVLEG